LTSRKAKHFTGSIAAAPDFRIAWVRSSFPALNSGDNFIFFDNAAGPQVPQVVLDAVIC